MEQDVDTERIELGTRLKEAREYLSLSQDEVAKFIGVPRSAVSMMEAGQRKVDAIELKKLSRLLQRPVDYFTGAGLPLDVPENVRHLARTATNLSDKDREELLRFAEFLRSRTGDR